MTQPDDLTWRLRAWSRRRQGLLDAAPEPLAALRQVVGVYSSHPSAPLSLLARSSALDAAAFGELEARRAVVRLPALRGSVFLLPADTAPLVRAALRQPGAVLDRFLEIAGLDRDEYARLKPLVLDAAAEPPTAAELQQRVATTGRLMTVVRVMSQEGLMLRLGSSLRTDNPRYVSAEAWLGQPLADSAADAGEALSWLAAAYLRAFGPARVADFAWWAGVKRLPAAGAIAALDTVDLGGGYRLMADEAAAFARVEPADATALDALPKWDAYAMGYAPDGRQRFVDDAHRPHAYSVRGQGSGTAGDALPVLLRAGRAVATWGQRFVGNRLLVTVSPFAGEIAPALGELEPVFARIGQLLGASAVEVLVAGA